MIARLACLLATGFLLPGMARAEAPKVQLPPAIAAHVPDDLRSYFIAFKTTPAVRIEMSTPIFEAHQAYIREQIENRVYLLVGPVTDDGPIRGVTILTAASIEEARRIVEADPAVRAMVLDVEVHPAVFPNLDSLKIGYPNRPSNQTREQ
jgi:uncharacterized protein YciI